MAKVSFSDEIKVRPQRQNFPRLKRLKKDEKVRIQLVDPGEVEMEFFHSLNAPVIENGEGVRNEDGSWKMRYLGSPLSLGDFGTLSEVGLDPDNCPVSAFAKKHPDWVQAPKRKFAMHAIKYRTKQNSFDLANPFSVEHIVWTFTDTTFLKLQEMNKEWGDLRKHDLYITCTNEKFQQYDIQVAPKAAWLEDLKTTKENYTTALNAYKAGVEEFPDLAGAIGQPKERKFLEMDLREIEDAWNTVLGKGSSSTVGTSEDLDSLLDGVVESPKKAESPWDLDPTPSVPDAEPDDFASLLAELDS